MIIKKTKEKYYEAIGRRKTAIARVRLWSGVKSTAHSKEFIVNGKNLNEYFKVKEFQDILMEPFVKAGISNFKVSIKVAGSGLKAQSFAARHGLSRALVMIHPESKSILKTLGFLTRDPRKKERKKPGLKGARRAPQWSKR